MNTRFSYRADRKIILIDIENLAGTPSPTEQDVQSVVDRLRLVLPDFDRTQKIVACSHHAAPMVAFSFPWARHIWRSGPDGADLALLDVLENERVEERFQCAVVCSGDGIFAPAAAWLARHGVDVTVVSLSGHLSARLELAARHVCYLSEVVSLPAAGSAI